MEYTATYSPEDNKLRLYSLHRLDKDLYLRVKAAGFRWAPKQELFVAPMWTPGREDLLIELAGEIGDEDTSLVERQEERADRFGGYSDNRAADAESAHAGVEAITKHIPMGQPILVGHHSEKHARKDAERIENGMRKAVKMWETSKYWTDRAAGAIRHAKYKELPRVRVNRIRKIESEIRKSEARYTPKGKHTIMQERWYCPTCHAAGNRGVYGCKEHPEAKKEVPHIWCAPRGGRGGSWTPVESLPAIKARETRWIKHYNNRLAYEKAMLGEQGELKRLEPRKRPAQPPLLNYRIKGSITVPCRWRRGETDTLTQIEMTKAEYKKIYDDYRGTRFIENSHRIRTAMIRDKGEPHYSRTHFVVFLTDSKIHEKPEPVEAHPAEAETPHQTKDELQTTWKPPELTKFDTMKDQLKEGVKIAVAPQLFPTPPDIAAKMVDYAGIDPDHSVLEPSAGTGNLIEEIKKHREPGKNGLIAYEINASLSDALQEKYPDYTILTDDFLTTGEQPDTYDRIVMNPPFENGVDIKHIKHAAGMLRPGGRLVALCANGPRQKDQLQDLCTHWEDLPADSFKEQGTGVNVALLVIDKADEKEYKATLF